MHLHASQTALQAGEEARLPRNVHVGSFVAVFNVKVHFRPRQQQLWEHGSVLESTRTVKRLLLSRGRSSQEDFPGKEKRLVSCWCVRAAPRGGRPDCFSARSPPSRKLRSSDVKRPLLYLSFPGAVRTAGLFSWCHVCLLSKVMKQ